MEVFSVKQSFVSNVRILCMLRMHRNSRFAEPNIDLHLQRLHEQLQLLHLKNYYFLHLIGVTLRVNFEPFAVL